MRRNILVALAIVSVFTIGCGTNRLHEYNLRGMTALYRVYNSGSGSTRTTFSNQNNTDILSELGIALGQTLVSGESRAKLARAINPDSIALAVSHGVQFSSEAYLGLREVASINQDPDFIIETSLDDYRLESTALGVQCVVCATTRIVDRATGDVVWKTTERETVNMSNFFGGGVDFGQPEIVNVREVVNAVSMLAMSEDDIKRAVQASANQAGREIGECLREDATD